MKKKNRWLALAMAGIMTVSALTACGSGSGTSQTPAGNQTEQTTAARQTEAGQQSTEGQPAEETPSGEREKLVVAITPEGVVTDIEDNYMSHRIEDDMNVELEFMVLPSNNEEFQTVLSLMASGDEEDMPDVFCTAITDDRQLEFGSNGFLIPIQDYMNDPEISPYFNSVPSEEDRKAMLASITQPDGNIYGYPRYMPNLFDVNETNNRFYLNKTWLDKLGLSVPKTTDELHEVLKAFATQDPNGNGVQDEIPIYGRFEDQAGGSDITLAMMNAFTYAPTWGGLVLDEDEKTVIAPYVQDEWREGLEYLHSLCEEGLMPESVFTDDPDQFKAVLNAPGDNLVGLVVACAEYVWQANADNMYDYIITEPFTGPEGACYVPYNPSLASGRWFITSACKNPELAARVGDYFFNEEISIISRYGEPGVNWTDDPEVVNDPAYSNGLIESGVWSERRIAVTEEAWGYPNNVLWGTCAPMYRDPALFPSVVGYWEDKKSDDAGTVDPLNSDYWNYMYYRDKVPRERSVVRFTYTLDEMDVLDAETTEIYDYVLKSTAQFITGALPLDDAGWEAYKADLDKIGLQTRLEISQTAWERANQ